MLQWCGVKGEDTSTVEHCRPVCASLVVTLLKWCAVFLLSTCCSDSTSPKPSAACLDPKEYCRRRPASCSPLTTVLRSCLWLANWSAQNKEARLFHSTLLTSLSSIIHILFTSKELFAWTGPFLFVLLCALLLQIQSFPILPFQPFDAQTQVLWGCFFQWSLYFIHNRGDLAVLIQPCMLWTPQSVSSY